MSSELGTALIPALARMKSHPHKIGDLVETPKPLFPLPVKLLFGFEFQLGAS